MDKIKSNKDNEYSDKNPNMNDTQIDTSMFDKTLRQIEDTLVKLGEKNEFKHRFVTDEDEYDKKDNKNEEHTIDNTHIHMEELHDFSSEPLKKEKKPFGFYTYLAITIGIIFAIYEILNVSKNFIILKYPITEPYIEYFYEVIEILAYIIMNFVSFVKNLF